MKNDPIIYIYDMEVFSHDWLLCARKPNDDKFVIIWNDNAKIKDFIKTFDILGGFNNKHYDDYIMRVILRGGDNVEVKKMNDFIIESRRKPWEFPFIQFMKKPFNSFDLRDDVSDKELSLKAVEGNLKLKIIESSVPFDIDRPLTEEEKREVEKYCKHDVNCTVALYKERKENYLDAKMMAGSLYGIDAVTALGLTNAKLSAAALKATYVERDDERNYKIPKEINVDKIPKICLNFFSMINDKSIPDAILFGDGRGRKGKTLDFWFRTNEGSCPVTISWGGIHGAKPCVIVEEDENRVIINQDVGSLYPNSMINFGYTSRSMEDPSAYKKLVELRLNYKAKAKETNKKITETLGVSWYKKFVVTENDAEFFSYEKAKKETLPATYDLICKYIDYDRKQASLKLIINTCYGAMLTTANGLNDRLAGRSVCITNQLAMIMLIVELAENCSSIDFININTDGVMFSIDKKEVELSEKIVGAWCKITRFTMERDDFSKVIQKDVNNYIGIYSDGHFKTKGGFVSLYNGGNFKTNSLQIIDKAIVDYLVKGISPEETIKNCKDINAFQRIEKAGHTFNGMIQYINGKPVNIQNANRIYAVKNKAYGEVKKTKWIYEKKKKNKETGKFETFKVDPPIFQEQSISESPLHCFIDNENILTIDQLDFDYYIDIAKKRINDYLVINKKKERDLTKIKEEVVIMATTKTNNNVYSKLLDAREMFLNSNIKKEGINSYAEFDYFRLEEIVPIKTAIFKKVGLVDVVNFTEDNAVLTVINIDNPEEQVIFTSQLANDESMIKNPIQKVGAIHTYVRRYLYMLALDIIEGDVIEATTGKAEQATKALTAKAKATMTKKPKTQKEREEIATNIVAVDAKATTTQLKSINNGLKKLRDSKEDHESYIAEVVAKGKKGLSKKEADAILQELGEKINDLK